MDAGPDCLIWLDSGPDCLIYRSQVAGIRRARVALSGRLRPSRPTFERRGHHFNRFTGFLLRKDSNHGGFTVFLLNKNSGQGRKLVLTYVFVCRSREGSREFDAPESLSTDDSDLPVPSAGTLAEAVAEQDRIQGCLQVLLPLLYYSRPGVE